MGQLVQLTRLDALDLRLQVLHLGLLGVDLLPLRSGTS
jgi:hypothetical protein